MESSKRPSTPRDTEQRSASHLVSPGPRRFILPGVSGLLSLGFLIYTLYLPREHPTMLGPVTQGQASLMAGICFLVLCIITSFLAALPDDSFTWGAPEEAETPEEVQRLGDAPGNSDAVVQAMKRAAGRHAHLAQQANARADRAEAEAAALREELDGVLRGTSESGMALRAEIIDSIRHESVDRIQQMHEAQGSLIASLRASKEFADRDRDRALRRVEEIEGEIEAACLAAVQKDRLRLYRTFLSVQESTSPTLSDAEAAAVNAFSQRVVAAYQRLDPAVTPMANVVRAFPVPESSKDEDHAAAMKPPKQARRS